MDTQFKPWLRSQKSLFTWTLSGLSTPAATITLCIARKYISDVIASDVVFGTAVMYLPGGLWDKKFRNICYVRPMKCHSKHQDYFCQSYGSPNPERPPVIFTCSYDHDGMYRSTHKSGFSQHVS